MQAAGLLVDGEREIEILQEAIRRAQMEFDISECMNASTQTDAELESIEGDRQVLVITDQRAL